MKTTGYTVACDTCKEAEFYGITPPPGRVEVTGAAKTLRERCQRNGLNGCRFRLDQAEMELSRVDQVRLGLADEAPKAPVPEAMTPEEREHYAKAPARRAVA